MITEYPVGTIFGDEELTAIKHVLDSGMVLSRGEEIDMFEREFADYCGAKYAVAVSSCGAALHIATKLLGLGEGDEVVCQANAFWVTIVHLLERGVTIKCADIDAYSLNIDPKKIEPLINKKTKAIYLVHHGGNPADLDPIYEIAKNNGLSVVEDCAHAVGAEYKGQKIGKNSDISCFSFSTHKNISTLGEGGMIVTNNKDFAEMAVGLRTNFPFGEKLKRQVTSLGMHHKPKSLAFMHAGDAWDYDWIKTEEFGSSYRMTTVQAAVGRVQLKKLDQLNDLRKNIAEKYNVSIDQLKGFRKLSILPGCNSSWYLFSFFIKPESGINREKLIEYLDKKHRLQTVLRYWPIHLGGIMRMKGHRIGDCPVTERVWFKEQMSLPISPQMTDDEIATIVDALYSAHQEFVK
jgi:perosamine synthetase